MTNCTECGSDNIEKINEERFKCLDCGHSFTQEEIDETQEFRDEEGDARKVEEERERNEEKDTDWDEDEDQTGDGVGDPDDIDLMFG